MQNDFISQRHSLTKGLLKTQSHTTKEQIDERKNRFERQESKRSAFFYLPNTSRDIASTN